MSSCTFFGHRNCPDSIQPRLEAEILALIRQGVHTFYVGQQGEFDRLVCHTLRQLQRQHPQIRYAVVLTGLPTNKNSESRSDETVYPEEVAVGPPRFAIDRRNRWMVRTADCVICYVTHSWGGAYKFAALAKKHGKPVINLHDGDDVF